MVAFIDAHRAVHGVESICAQLPIAPSQYYAHKAREAKPEHLPSRLQRDRTLVHEIRRIYEENFRVYGARKVWRQLGREGLRVARCTVERLMHDLGLQGVVRGRKRRTTFSDDRAERPLDRVNRQFWASQPNQLWVADFTYVATWSGFVDVASSSMCSRGASSAGAWRARCAPIWSWTRWNKRCGRVPEPAASFIIRTGVANTCRFATPSASPRLARSPRLAALATPTTTRWPRRSSASTRPRSSTSAGRGGTLTPSSTPPLEWVDWFNNRRLLEPM